MNKGCLKIYWKYKKWVEIEIRRHQCLSAISLPTMILLTIHNLGNLLLLPLVILINLILAKDYKFLLINKIRLLRKVKLPIGLNRCWIIKKPIVHPKTQSTQFQHRGAKKFRVPPQIMALLNQTSLLGLQFHLELDYMTKVILLILVSQVQNKTNIQYKFLNQIIHHPI